MKIRIGVSACLIGDKCNFNGKDLLSGFVSQLSGIEEIELVRFCPEDFVFGTPRANLRIVGGDGYDVLDGRASVIDENGADVTEKQIAGAQKFLERLQRVQVEYAILMEGSPSCGSSVLLAEESWPAGGFKKGVGVASALLQRNGIRVFGSFDERTISAFLRSHLSDFQIDDQAVDLRDMAKFKTLFQSK